MLSKPQRNFIIRVGGADGKQQRGFINPDNLEQHLGYTDVRQVRAGNASGEFCSQLVDRARHQHKSVKFFPRTARRRLGEIKW